MEAYRITDWPDLYEVTGKGSPAATDTAPDKLKKGPLKFVRWQVFGRQHSEAYRNLLKIAWRQGEIFEMAVFGIFGKLLELAGDQDREFRGWILDRKQRPMTITQIAEVLGILSVARCKQAIDMLCDQRVGWVELAEFPGLSQDVPGVPRTSQVLVANSPSLFINETENETVNNNTTEKQENLVDPCPDGSASVSENTDQVLTQAIAKKRATFCMTLQTILPAWTDTDTTTFLNLTRQLEGMAIERGDPGLFDEALQVASTCKYHTAKNPKAVFIARCKTEFGFTGTSRPIAECAGGRR